MTKKYIETTEHSAICLQWIPMLRMNNKWDSLFVLQLIYFQQQTKENISLLNANLQNTKVTLGQALDEISFSYQNLTSILISQNATVQEQLLNITKMEGPQVNCCYANRFKLRELTFGYLFFKYRNLIILQCTHKLVTKWKSTQGE